MMYNNSSVYIPEHKDIILKNINIYCNYPNKQKLIFFLRKISTSLFPAFGIDKNKNTIKINMSNDSARIYTLYMK